MKIVCISASLVPSEFANSIQAMKACQALAQLGHAVTLLVPGGQQAAASEQKLMNHYGLKTPFEVIWLPARSRRWFAWEAVRRARRLGPDLLYVWPLQAAALGLLARLPVLLEMHDLPSGRIGPLWYHLFLKLPSRKRIAPITRALQAALDERYGKMRPDEAVIAPNGVDLERFAGLPGPTAARRQLGLPDLPTVVCTGHLYVGRGANLFLDLAGAFPQANFLWAGGRPEEVSEWQMEAGKRGLRNVIFTGFVANARLPLYQAAAEVLLMPYGRAIAISSGMGHSARVASPMKMFEYMASERAILTSDLPMLREVLDESSAAFCPPEDFAAWRTALGALLTDDRRRQGLARRARAEVEAYTWVKRAGRILAGFTPATK
jgi:glycosyltransferase involved in cell wall biosynthesis